MMEKHIYIEFDREKSQIIKGIAILTMIIHHCIVIPSGDSILDMFGASMKICISYFTFLVGFGYAFSRKNIKEGLQRVFKLLVQFWLLLFFVFIPFYLCCIKNEVTFYQIITNMFGLKSDLHWFSWYLYYYMYAMIIMPFAASVIDRFEWKALFCLILISYVLEYGIHSISNYDKNIFTQVAFNCLFNSPLLFLGYYMAKYNIFCKCVLNKYHTFPLIILFLIAISAVIYKRVVLGFMLDFFYIPMILLSVLGIFTLNRLSLLRSILVKLGDMSMPMWFIHAMFIMPFVTTAWIDNLSFGNPLIKFVIVVLMSYFLACIFDEITRPLMKYI